MERLRLAIFGAGNRGMEVYGELALRHPRETRVVAVVDPDDYKRSECARRHGIPADRQFRGAEDFFAAGKIADVLVVSGPDGTHYGAIKAALEVGYDLLLEKPISSTVDTIRDIAELGARHPERSVVVCHVLRYAPFFDSIKRILDSGTLGDLISIEHHEHIGYSHFAHSYVRGNWRRSDQSSPLVLAKSCHDMDILRYFAGSPCASVSAFGGLAHFRSERAPEGASDRCSECSLRDDCPFSAYRIYADPSAWPASVVAPTKTREELERRLAEGPYGRCVYRCDNDAIDHLSAGLSFENGVTASFSISAFTADITRVVRLMGTKGELCGDMRKNEIEVNIFGSGRARVVPDVIPPEAVGGGHCGGDARLFENFLASMAGRSSTRSSLAVSLESHLMALAIEKSRLEGREIKLAEL
jgi:Predicted dehydrogenases and related proteins